MEKIPLQAPVGPAGRTGQVRNEPAPGVRRTGTPSFGEILRKEIEGESIKFSGHAQMRMRARNISLSESDMAKLIQAIDKASAKGARESLILMDELALVVSIRNRTVITAVDGEHVKENVFTNIDSAVIV
ncbi:MAG: TIGR02530 family flagellar biosynthesis protein [Bacillota bacterium]